MVLRDFHRQPSALAYMTRAMLRPPATRRGNSAVGLAVRWRGLRVDARQRDELRELAGCGAGLDLLYPHVIGFRLTMALLTAPAFPLPIWRALQVRNRITAHAPLPPAEPLDLTAEVVAQRIVERGMELDLRSGLRSGDRLVWESLTLFLYRGHHGAPDAGAPAATAPPRVEGPEIARWRMPGRAGWRFGRLTGDYNGIHVWPVYARRFGFRDAFFHPQLVIGQCLARLPAPGPMQQLETWLKGPVFYDSDVVLSASKRGAEVEFALRQADDARPCIVGRWTRAGSA